VYILSLAALLARPIAGWLQPERVRDIWGNFFAGLVMAVLLFVVAAGSAMRPANQFDRALGDNYRRTEVRVCYLLMACLAVMQLTGLILELNGFSSRRIAALLVTTCVCITLAGVMLLPSRTQSSDIA
jgi:predicted membrane channel-forming protein YqfA (hemolysin III family)